MNRPEDDEPKHPNEVREPRLSPNEALRVASEYFMGKADVQKAAARIAQRLDELGIDYAIVGGLAVSAHGHLRVTTDVDVLLRQEDLERFKAESLGRGWVEKFPGSRGVRDAVCNVPIDILLTGGFPGDGKEKPIAFPDPARVSEILAGLRFVTLPALVDLKVASGMSVPDRLQDLADVIALIRENDLPRSFSSELHPYVQDKYVELWGYAQRPTGEY